MALDMAKYANLFLEEAAEQLAEMSRAMLELEKNTSSAESIDVMFRMAHSIKSMAASLAYDSISEVAHRLEDRMQEIRTRGSVAPGDELGLLFRGLEGLEAMVGHVRDHGEPPPPDPDLLSALSQPSASVPSAPVREAGAAKKAPA